MNVECTLCDASVRPHINGSDRCKLEQKFTTWRIILQLQPPFIQAFCIVQSVIIHQGERWLFVLEI